MSIGERLRECRRNIHMSQEYLAEAVDVHANTIRKWEKGQRSPRAEELAKLAFALNTTVAYLTGETDDPGRVEAGSIEPTEQNSAVDVSQIKTEDRGMLTYELNGQKLQVPATPEYAAQFWARVDKLMGTQAV